MCGLIGLYLKNQVEPSGSEDIRRHCSSMLDTLSYRGPDEKSLTNIGPVWLGHTRLSIIDLQTGSQPIYNEDRSIAVLLNGEIYNYKELRAALEKRGHSFHSASDTEVIVHQYEESGSEVFSKLNGMFAIVIYDTKKNILIAARDRAGEKPLVYRDSPGELIMASEIKALLKYPGVSRTIDESALALYLNSMYVPAPLSMFSEIRKLPPAHYMIYDGSEVMVRKYWDPCIDIQWDWRAEDIVDEFESLFADAVRIRTFSDVPIGVFLSGGIDSSAVTAFMAKTYPGRVKSFTVGFSQEVDERPYARLVAERYRTDHTELFVDERIEDVAPRVLGYYDEPFGDSSAIPTYLVSKEARKHVKVILTGDGGDELFAGYGSYLDQKYLTGNRITTKLSKMLNRLALKCFCSGILEGFYRHATDRNRALEHWQWVRTVLTQEQIANALGGAASDTGTFFRDNRWLDVRGGDALSASYSFDLNFYLPDDLLKKVDMASMFSSIECRAPFLDHRLIELSLRIPPNLKVKDDCLKYLLKDAMKGYLPAEILNRPKTGFGAPVESWLKNQLREMVRDMLCPGCRSEQLVSRSVIDRYLRSVYETGAAPDYRVYHGLWLIFVLEIWIREYLK